MVFVAGPRQVGKTTFARQYLKKKARLLVISTGDNISNRQTCRTVGLTGFARHINYCLSASRRGGNVHQK